MGLRAARLGLAFGRAMRVGVDLALSLAVELARVHGALGFAGLQIARARAAHVGRGRALTTARSLELGRAGKLELRRLAMRRAAALDLDRTHLVGFDVDVVAFVQAGVSASAPNAQRQTQTRCGETKGKFHGSSKKELDRSADSAPRQLVYSRETARLPWRALQGAKKARNKAPRLNESPEAGSLLDVPALRQALEAKGSTSGLDGSTERITPLLAFENLTRTLTCDPPSSSHSVPASANSS